jgi:hypothetical protein
MRLREPEQRRAFESDAPGYRCIVTVLDLSREATRAVVACELRRSSSNCEIGQGALLPSMPPVW